VDEMNLPEKSEVKTRAEEAINKLAGDGSLADDDWGMWSQDDPPGYTPACLSWFASTKSLFDYLKYYMPFIGFQWVEMTNGELHACHEWSDTLNELFTEFSSGDISEEDMVGFINGSEACSTSWVRWIGKVDDLMSGDHEFEEEIRYEYFDKDPSDSEPPPPIPIPQKSDFVEYVADFFMR
jgi:hypothetical protein